MQDFKTEQENFWAGDFGNRYIERNQGEALLANKLALWSGIIKKFSLRGVKTCLEFGTNIGLNLQALGLLLPHLNMSGVEINQKAAQICSKLPRVKIYNESALTFETDEKYDFTFTCGVLIHIAPDKLPIMYEKLYRFSNKYIVISEYYNPTPVEVNYRGHKERLFKRDFAGEIMDMFPNVRLIDYGFGYHRDNNFDLGDSTWFIMEKVR